MNTETNEKTTKVNLGSKVIDIITIGLLFAAYAVVFYAGFILKSEDFSMGWIAVISLVGITALFAVGTCSCLISKVRTNSLSVGFLAFSAFQLAALIGNYVLMGSLLIKMTTVDNTAVKISYILEVAVILIGYVVDVFSFDESNSLYDDDYEDDDYDDEEYDDDDEDYEDAVEEEIDNEAVEESDETAADESTEASDEAETEAE